MGCNYRVTIIALSIIWPSQLSLLRESLKLNKSFLLGYVNNIP